jgi:O-antigen/teichoic acid export membrane protein
VSRPLRFLHITTFYPPYNFGGDGLYVTGMDGGRQNEFRRNTASLFSLELIFRSSGFIILAVMSRTLAADQIGSYFFVISLAEAFSIVAGLNLNAVVMRRLAAERARAAEHLAGYLGLRLATALPYFACVLGAASFFPKIEAGLVLAGYVTPALRLKRVRGGTIQ